MDAADCYARQCADMSKGPWSVKWSEQDSGYAATCSGFWSLSWLACTPAGALLGLTDLILRDLRHQMAELGVW